jgi:hypothetical protein
MRQTEDINARILMWARKATGLTVEEAADKLALGSSERATAASKLSALESGDPTADLCPAADSSGPLQAAFNYKYIHKLFGFF